MVEIKDILLKAAEDVQSGMWCSGAWFSNERDGEFRAKGETVASDAAFAEGIEAVRGKYRCAEGSIQFATVLLGGNYDDYDDAVDAVSRVIRKMTNNRFHVLETYNDGFLPPDPFEAGQQLAELFRSTAESL